MQHFVNDPALHGQRHRRCFVNRGIVIFAIFQNGYRNQPRKANSSRQGLACFGGGGLRLIAAGLENSERSWPTLLLVFLLGANVRSQACGNEHHDGEPENKI